MTALALWLLQRLYPERNREALAGDLIERLHEGCSRVWFLRQVLIALLAGGSRQLRLRGPGICASMAGTFLIWWFPWGRIFPLQGTNWSSQLRWLIPMELLTALLVQPLFAILFRFRKGKLLRAFLICAILFTAGDLPAIWWGVKHPGTAHAPAVWVVALMLGWIFASLLAATRIAGRFSTRPARA